MLSIAWPTDIPVSQPFGCTTLTVEPPWPPCPSGHLHCGIDIATPLGTPLYFPRAGKVSWIGPALLAFSSGKQTDWFVHIDHVAPGIYVGKLVDLGDLAAYSGNKIPGGGASTGPHTHFEIQNWPWPRFAYYDDNGRLVRPPGSLNNPATCVDPTDVLAGRFSAGGAELELPPTTWRKTMGLNLGIPAFLGIGNDDQLYLFYYSDVAKKFTNLVVGTGGKWKDFDAATDGENRVDIYARGLTADEGWHAVIRIVNGVPAVQQWESTGGEFKSPLAAFAPKASSAATPAADLSPILGAVADLKTAIGNIKISGGGLTPEQDAHLAAIETAVEQVEQQLTSGLQITGAAKA